MSSQDTSAAPAASTESANDNSAEKEEKESVQVEARKPENAEDLLFLPPQDAPSERSSISTVFSSVPSLISSRLSSARNSRTSSGRNSRSSKSDLATIKEVPQCPDFPVLEPSRPEPQPQYHAIPLLQPPPNFQPIIQSQIPGPQNPFGIHYPQYQQPGVPMPPASPPQAQSPPEKHSFSSNGSWPLPNGSSDDSKASFNHQLPFYSPQDGTMPKSFLPYAVQFDMPGSRFSGFSWNEMSKSQKVRSFFTRWFVEWWLLEILSWAFSAICMTVILVVLMRYNGGQIPKWKMGLTLNSFISVLSGFAKSSLLLPTAEALGQLKWNWFKRQSRKMMDFEILDSASRGPWGSFVLLARTKGITLASVGAAIILLSLPLDLFFQQIVSYPTVWVRHSSASIARSVEFAPGAGISTFNGSALLYPNNMMEGYTRPYFFDNPILPEVNIDCATSNCTWAPFNTLSVCSSCTAAPSLLTLDCQTGSGDWLSNVAPLIDLVIPNVTSCGWYLTVPEQDPILMTGYSFGPNGSLGDAMAMRMLPLTDAFTRKTIRGGSINFKYTASSILDFLVAVVPDGLEGAYRNATPTVHECELHWCVNKVQSTYYQGKLDEKVLETTLLESNITAPFWNNKNLFLTNLSHTITDPHTDPGMTFGLTNVTMRQTIQTFDEFFPSSLVGKKTTVIPQIKWTWRQLPQLQDMPPETNPWMPTHDIGEHVKNMAVAMGRVLRQTRNSKSDKLDQVSGDAWEQQVLVTIRWVWVTLPAFLLVFSFIFLATTVVRSSKEENGVGIWKTSALAVLFNGLGEDVQSKVGSNLRMGDARSKARDIKVKLEE